MMEWSNIGAIESSRFPRVVGTIVTAAGLRQAQDDRALPCDLVEVRLDHLLNCADWLAQAQAIERKGWPVLVTLRSAAEGGKWTGPDEDRIPYLRQALETVSAVDVELQASIAPLIATAARAQDKTCIVSFHDFDRTPSDSDLHTIISRAEQLGSIVKVSAMARDAGDVARLRALLKTSVSKPLCVIAMGPLGTPTRVSFAAEGSCLTYGFLDQPGAPGQLSAAQLVQALSESCPAYAQARPVPS